jgi:glycosyltransferase involved in cell wall biosynthesis
MRSLYKIVHTTCQTGWGGLERRIFNESVWMENRGHKVVIVAPKGTPIFRRAQEHGFRVYDVSFKGLNKIKDHGRLKKIFRDEQPHILNTHGNTDSKIALLAARKTGVPCRILSRHISAHVRNTWYNKKIYKQLSHFIFTTAGYTTRHLQQVFKLKGMEIFSMPSGIIEPETLMPKEDARKALAEELCLDPGTRFIGFSGRVSSDKGVGTIIEALKHIRAEIPHHIAIVGAGIPSYLAELKALAQSLGIEDRVHFTGFKEEVWPYYRAFDCKVLASINKDGIPFEGVPQALLEAMYSSCPVIGSKSGGISDIITHEKTGLLFEPQNPKELSEMILKTLTREAATMERVYSARQRAKKSHTIDAMGRDIIRIYRLHQVKLDNRSIPRINSQIR